MRGLRFMVEANQDAQGPRPLILMAKALDFADYRSAYSGLSIGLICALSPSREACAPGLDPQIAYGYSGLGQLRSLLMDYAETYLSRPGGYIPEGQVYAIISQAPLDAARRPLAFYARHDYDRAISRFLASLAQALWLNDGPGSLSLV